MEMTPFKTIQEAAEAVKNGAREVELSGVQFTQTPTRIGKECSGSAENPVLVRGNFRLIGGVPLKASWFAPHDAPIMVCDLRARGIVDYGTIEKRAGWGWNAIAPMELFQNGKAMTLGQSVEFLVTEVPQRNGGWFVCDEPLLNSLAETTEDPWFGGLFGTYWYWSMVRGLVTGSVITLEACPQYGIKPGMPFRVMNVFPQAPGQYYIDRTKGKLYYWPERPLQESDQLYVSLVNRPLLTLEADYLDWSGLTVEAGRAGLVDLRATKSRLIGCIVRNSGTYGVSIDGQNSSLRHCTVRATGERGVLIRGGDRKTLTPAGNSVVHCDVSDWGRLVQSSKVGIHVEGVGQFIGNNRLHNAPVGAVWFYGNNHQIERNDIHHVCHSTADAGAIYAGRDWSFRGTTIIGNYIHDMASPYTPWELFGVYLDDCLSGTKVYTNLFRNIRGFATFNAGGRDNLWDDNRIANCYGAHRTDRRGMDIITNTPGHDCNFLQKLNQAAGGDFKTNSAWMQAYPELADIPDDYNLWGDLKNPGGTFFNSNKVWDVPRSKWLSEGTWGGVGALDYYREIRGNSFTEGPAPEFDTSYIGPSDRVDFNQDGVVDLADYTIWADSFGQTGDGLPADANGDGKVDMEDYTIWADAFGHNK